MSYWVEKCIEELEGWKQRAFYFLSERLTPDAISHYFEEYQRDPLGLYEKTRKEVFPLTPSFYGAIASIIQINSLLNETKQPLDENIPIEIAARFAVLSFRAGYETGTIQPARGMEVLEPLAKTRFAQKKNQPKTRSRINIGKDDIVYRLEEYYENKGNLPKRLDNFLLFLSSAGYEINRVDNTVMSPAGVDNTWSKPRAFGTITNDIRDYRKSTIS